jgi:hypothetical protein
MTATVVYVHPACAPQYESYALRFLASYAAHPPGTLHDTIIGVNGGPVTHEIQCLFASLPRVRFIEHDNSGWDIGLFQRAARQCDSDCAVFFGASTYFKRPGWLVRMMTAQQKHGKAQYGAMGNRGAPQVKVAPHLRTTGFWCPPALMNAYPHRVLSPGDRHPFEHGPACFTTWLSQQRIKSWEITWTRDLLWEEWGADPNGYHRGDQSSLLAADRMCEPPYYAHP